MSGRAARSLAASIGVVVALGILSVPAAAARPDRGGGGGGSSAPATLVAAEFNLSGWQMHRGGLDPAKTVVERVKATKPAVVGVVEVCSARRGQWEHIRSELGRLGYSFVWSPSIANLGFAGCEQFGNGLAVLGKAGTPSILTFEAQRVNWDGAYQELRNIACAPFTAPDRKALTACVTHLVNRVSSDAATTSAQAAEALSFAETAAAGRRIVAGDFNLHPSDPALDGWYAEHREADASLRSGWQATHDSGTKLDYLFGDAASFAATTTAEVEPVSTSDHHWYRGSFPTI
jgi:endonuclease/exonuclease/phosphatase family metal-dependent hydrolase